MATRVTEISGHPVRFSIPYKGKRYKVFSYFSAASDKSLALHTYLKWNYTGQVDFEENFIGKPIDISKIQKNLFKVHKTNFHGSGAITQKNKENERFSIDISGMNFRHVKDAISLFFLRPVEISHYPLIDKDKTYFDLRAESDDILPPVIQGYLCKKDFDFMNEFKPKDSNGNYFIDKKILDEFNLNLFIYIRKAEDNTWPSAQAKGLFKY